MRIPTFRNTGFGPAVAGVLAMAVSGWALGASPGDGGLGLVPWPHSVSMTGGGMTITASTRIMAASPALLPAARILADDIYRTTALRLEVREGPPAAGDIALLLDGALKGEAYSVTVTDSAAIRGGTYQAVCWGAATVLQAIGGEGGRLGLPRMTVNDRPDAPFRCAQVCCKHQPHRLETIREAIDLCRLYKINYFTLHRGGYQAWWALCPAFRQDPLPKGPYDGGATIGPDEMSALVRYADERGVTYIPDLGLSAFWGASWLFKAMPEYFDKPRYANAGDKTQFLLDDPGYWAAVDTLVARTADMFKSSPWIHFGAIDGEVPSFGETPFEKEFMKRNHLRDSADVWAYVMKRYDAIAKKHGKKSMAYEGVQRGGALHVNLPRDVVFLEYQDAYYPVKEMAQDGFAIVNYSWQPMYVAGRGSPLREIYNWDRFRWQNNWFKIAEDRVPRGSNVIGGMIGTWEGPDLASIPALRRRAAAMSQRLWNPGEHPDYARFLARLEAADRKVQLLFYPAGVEVQGVEDHPSFDTHEAARYANEVTLRASPVLPGAVHYTLDGSDPTPESPVLREALRARPAQFKAALFDAEGKQVGDTYVRHFEFAPVRADVQGVLRDWPQTGQPWWEPARVFQESVRVTLTSGAPGLTVHYLLGQANRPVSADDPAADGPLTFRNETRLRAQCFDGQGQAQGAGFDVTYVNYGFEPNMLVGAGTRSGKPGQPGQPDPGGRFAADGIIDKENHWGNQSPCWLELSLPSPQRIDRLQLWNYWDGSRFYQYTVEASLDGSRWQTIVDRSRNTQVATEKGYEDKFAPVSMRFLRITILKNSANIGCHISEVRAFGPK